MVRKVRIGALASWGLSAAQLGVGRVRRAALPLAGLLIGLAPAASAEMVAHQGDVLLVSVLEDPQLGREARVNADGAIMLPRLGEIEAAGQDLLAIRDRIEDELRARDIIRAPTVLVEFASYRPFYVGGAVAEPGAIPFEPGLTVRHALVLAGGLDLGEDAAVLTSTELDDLRSRLQLASYQLVQQESLVARLDAELDRDPAPDLAPPDEGLVSALDVEALRAIDAELLGDRIAGWHADQARLQDALALVDVEIDVLERQAELQESERQLQLAEVENARTLVERGLLPRSRLQELEREASRLSRELLDNQAFAARARQDRAAAEHDLENAETLWRIKVQEELRDATLERMRLEAEVEALRDRMLTLGLLIDAAGTSIRPVPAVVIYRTGASGTEATTAGMDAEVLPGDVLEVAIAPPPAG